MPKWTADNLGIICWFVDISNVIHDDCKGHTHSMLTLGSGAIMNFSRKQKNISKSAIEAELIGMNDVIP